MPKALVVTSKRLWNGESIRSNAFKFLLYVTQSIFQNFIGKSKKLLSGRDKYTLANFFHSASGDI